MSNKLSPLAKSFRPKNIFYEDQNKNEYIKLDKNHISFKVAEYVLNENKDIYTNKKIKKDNNRNKYINIDT
jgi:hypothetical protein